MTEQVKVGLATVLGIVGALLGGVVAAASQITDGPEWLTKAGIYASVALIVVTQIGRYIQAFAQRKYPLDDGPAADAVGFEMAAPESDEPTTAIGY